MPPIVARLEVESSGGKNRPCSASAALSWSFTTPACTRTQRSSGLISRMRFMWRETSTTRPFRQRLAVGAGSAAAGREHEALEARLGRDTGDAHQVIDVARKRDELGKQLIDRVVGRRDDPVAIGRRQIAFEAAQPQFRGQFGIAAEQGPAYRKRVAACRSLRPVGHRN